MGMRQAKIAKNLGRDTHVRDHSVDIFRGPNHNTTQMIIGEVLIPEPEPIFRQNMVTVQLARGGNITDVAYPGAFIDPVTGNLHGSYEGPHPGQMVVVGFENGNVNTPFVVNRYPYQGVGNTLTEAKYISPLTRKGFHSSDVLMGHLSGSYLAFNTGILPSTQLPGSVSLHGVTDVNIDSTTNILLDALVSAEVKGAVAKLTGTTSALVTAADVNMKSSLGGEVDVAALIKVKNSAQSMKTLIDALIDVVSGLTTTNCAVGAPVALSPATIALLAAEKAKWALLLAT